MSSFLQLLGPSSSLSSGFEEDKFSNNSIDPYLTSPIAEGVCPLEDYKNNHESDTRNPLSPPTSDSIQGFPSDQLGFPRGELQ